MPLRLRRILLDFRDWAAAHAELSAADRESPLEPPDLELLITAAYLLGRDDEAAQLSARAYREWLRRGDPVRAARVAFWLAFHLLLRGSQARGGGWLARAGRLSVWRPFSSPAGRRWARSRNRYRFP